MTVRRVGRYTVSARPCRVYLDDDAADADCGLTYGDATALGEALLLAAYEATRSAGLPSDEPLCTCAGARWRHAAATHRRNDT
jgi:hypothetical protein